jgi:RNA polymerase sigma-70 factor (ECF subfamily)
MDDDELTAAVAAGDDSALRELFSRHAPWLAGRLRSVLRAADVEDVLQETFLGVWRSADRYRPAGAAGGWMWGIARRQAALFLRRSGPCALVLPAVLAADGRHAADPAEAALSRTAIAEAVVALGPEGSPGRETWRLMYVEDWSEAGRAMNPADAMARRCGVISSSGSPPSARRAYDMS